MSKINLLSKQVADLIAAGEVVERPASVVKEILENAIDAEATVITVEIKNGGIGFIRVTDNGTGIGKEDIPKAFKSHATSKISSADDLHSITSLSFRGEALASIAAVARVEMLTKTQDDDSGYRYCIEGGEETYFDEAGCPKGTTIIVRDLFFNTPARMKFLRKDVAEANAVASVVDKIALSHPEVSFRFIRDGKQVLLTPGDGDLYQTVYSVFGKDFASDLIPADYTLDNIRVSGYVSKPSASRPNRNMQYFFLNGRQIKTPTGSSALSEAYKHSIASGKFPCCVLNIEASPEFVDVNVHPAKTEVRFVNDKPVFSAVYYCAKNAVDGVVDRPSITVTKKDVADFLAPPEPPEQINLTEQPKGIFAETSRPFTPVRKADIDIEYDEEDEAAEPAVEKTAVEQSLFEAPKPYSADNEEQIAEKAEEKEADEPESVEEQIPVIKQEPPKVRLSEPEEFWTVKGELFGTYILVEMAEKIILIDKHAAHERIIFNKLLNEDRDQATQLLLEPIVVLLSKPEYDVLIENIGLMRDAGFEVEDFGSGSVLVRECPMSVQAGEVKDIVIELAGYLLQNRTILLSEKLEWLLTSIACRAAIKAGDFTSEKEREQFVQTLMQMPEVRHCPHGRPVMVEMLKSEIEKSFNRS